MPYYEYTLGIPLEIKYEYVEGHRGVFGNEEAHKLAVMGSKKCLSWRTESAKIGI